MTEYRKPTPAEIEALTAAGNSAENWDAIEVAQNFTPAQLSGCRLEGRVQIGRGARLRRCTIRNYRIGEEALIEGVTALECRRESSFGNGVRVAAINENGGRTVRIYDRLTAQTAYILAVYRYRPEAVEAIERMIERYAAERRDTLGTVGPHARITGARFIREVNIGEGATIDGASLLENGTVCAGAYVGIDVQARDFIAAEGARIDGGTLLERCFAGECCTLDKHFTAVDSLFFANSHCENGEAVSIFAGPYTVSHHKSSLLIAGMFSFFNAGSGANQSNHLFKSGAVHQSVHLRGCKFGSGTYIMAPAIEGPFTLVLGRHTQHHDTSAFPFSYLVEQDGRSALMPGANLTSYMYTNVKLPQGGAYTNKERSLQGASPILANADLTYSPRIGEDRQLNLALLYNLQGSRIHAVGVSGLGDVRQQTLHTLNFSAGYSLNKHFNLKLQVNDLLNRDVIFKQDVPTTGQEMEVERYHKGTNFEVGISYNL